MSAIKQCLEQSIILDYFRLLPLGPESRELLFSLLFYRPRRRPDDGSSSPQRWGPVACIVISIILYTSKSTLACVIGRPRFVIVCVRWSFYVSRLKRSNSLEPIQILSVGRQYKIEYSPEAILCSL
jgi:hypothetical protein